MSSFNRENRYIVVNRSDLDKLYKDPNKYATTFGHALALIAPHLPKRQFLVIESDWPEYEPVWQMIEQRMSGAAPPELAELQATIARLTAENERLVTEALPDRHEAWMAGAETGRKEVERLKKAWHASVKVTTQDVMQAIEEIPGAPILTSNHCHALAMRLNFFIDKAKELN
jgi:hypothetical protein